jgi:hypothetical protein
LKEGSYPAARRGGADRAETREEFELESFEAEGVLRFAEEISGSYNFITALPVNRLILFLRDQGVDI